MTATGITRLFLSRLTLNPASRQVWSELAQPYELHKTLMRAFPKATDEKRVKARDEFGVLFRADMNDHWHRVTLYVQSVVEPDWSFLVPCRDYLLADPDPPKDVAAVYQRLQNGRVLSFRLRANPTKRIPEAFSGDCALRGKRVGLLREEAQIAWLIRKGLEREKGKPGGFEILMKEVEDQNGVMRRVPCVNVCPEGQQRGRKRESGQSHELTHSSVCFDGLLRITDVDAFRETLASGIGPAKAFGFGLLSVAPVR